MRTNLAILNIVMLTGVLTLFNNCGKGTYIDQNDLAVVDPEVAALITASPKLTAASYSVITGNSIALNIEGGKAPYSYVVNPASAGSVDASNVFHSNQPGVTAIEVRDSLGRSSSIAVDIKVKPAPPKAPTPAPAAVSTRQPGARLHER